MTIDNTDPMDKTQCPQSTVDIVLRVTYKQIQGDCFLFFLVLSEYDFIINININSPNVTVRVT